MKALILYALATVGVATALPAQSDRRRDRDEREGSRIDTTLTLAANGTVDLQLLGGEIIVTGGSGRQVRIIAESERAELRLEQSANRISLRTERNRVRSGDTEYRVTVPTGTRVVMASTSGELSARGTKGEVEATTMSGEISISDANGDVDAEALSGSVEISNVTGSVSVQAVSGDVTVENVTGTVEVESVSGEIELSRITSKSVRAVTVSGEIDFDGSIAPDGRYELNSHSGDVRVSLPDNVNALVSVSTFSGEIDSDFPLTLEPGDRRPQHQQFEFRIGSGGARIQLESFSGDIYLDRGSSRNRQGGAR